MFKEYENMVMLYTSYRSRKLLYAGQSAIAISWQSAGIQLAISWQLAGNQQAISWHTVGN
jgi:hypothetical protein